MVVFAKPWLMNQRGNPAKKNIIKQPEGLSIRGRCYVKPPIRTELDSITWGTVEGDLESESDGKSSEHSMFFTQPCPGFRTHVFSKDLSNNVLGLKHALPDESDELCKKQNASNLRNSLHMFWSKLLADLKIHTFKFKHQQRIISTKNIGKPWCCSTWFPCLQIRIWTATIWRKR